MNQNFNNISAEIVVGDVGSHNNVTYSERHVYQTGRGEQPVSINVLLSQINAIMTRPQTCRLDDNLKTSTRRTVLAIPELPVIESIVSQSPPDLHIVPRSDGCDLEATIDEILQIKSMVQSLLEPNIDNEVWQALARLFGNLGSRFAEIGWFVGALRMSYHDVQIRCALANLQSPLSADLSTSSINPSTPGPHHVEFLDAIARLLHHRSLYSANGFCFNDARKASRQAIRIQRELCLHDVVKPEYKSNLSWMERHLSSFRRQDAAYNVIVSRSVGNMVDTPADVSRSDVARGFLRLGIQHMSGMAAVISLIAVGPVAAGAVVVTGWGLGEGVSFFNRRS